MQASRTSNQRSRNRNDKSLTSSKKKAKYDDSNSHFYCMRNKYSSI